MVLEEKIVNENIENPQKIYTHLTLKPRPHRINVINKLYDLDIINYGYCTINKKMYEEYDDRINKKLFYSTDNSLMQSKWLHDYFKDMDYRGYEYYSKNSSLSDPVLEGQNVVVNPFKIQKDYEDIKLSRMTYGKRDFAINSIYIQTQDDASDLMKWLLSKIKNPRKAIGVKIFSNPTIQLGDIVSLKYKQNNIEKVNNSRYVVYSIDYSKDVNGPQMTVYLSEVA